MKNLQKTICLVLLAATFSLYAGNAHAFLIPKFFKTYLADAIRMKSLKTQNESEETQEQNNKKDAEKAANFGNRFGTQPLYNFMDKMDWDRFGENPREALGDAAKKAGMEEAEKAKKAAAEYAKKKQEEKAKAKAEQEAREREERCKGKTAEECEAEEKKRAENEKANSKFKESVYKWYKDNSGSVQSAVKDGGDVAAGGDVWGGLETGGKGLVNSFVDSQKDW